MMQCHRTHAKLAFVCSVFVMSASFAAATEIHLDNTIIPLTNAVGVYPTYDASTNTLRVRADYFRFCVDENAASCKSDLKLTMSTDTCSLIPRGATFAGYAHISASIRLDKDVSVDPTGVPKKYCRYVKKVSEFAEFSLDKIHCPAFLLYISGSLDSSNQIVSNRGTRSTQFEQRCQKDCQTATQPDDDNHALCTWCGRIGKGLPLFPDDSASIPASEDICGRRE